MNKFIKSILPGIFLIGFNIGTGSVTAMAKAGADYGMGLLWALLLSCLVTFFLIVWFGRYTLVTGETALLAFRKHIHPAVGMFFIIALTVNVCGSIMGVMGIVADVLFEWSKTWMDGGIHPVAWAGGIAIMIYLLFLAGATSFFEKMLALMVAVMGLCFLLNFIILTPSFSEILSGLVPVIPDALPGQKAAAPMLVTAGMVGTTVSSMIFIVRTTLVKEQGWTIQDSKLQTRDAGISAALMFVISGTIMAAAAAALHVKGIRLEHAKDMITLLDPVAGPFAVGIFVIGITAAGMSSQLPNILLLPWLICDFFSIPRDMRSRRFRIIVFAMSSLSLVVPLFDAPPILVMVASQAFAAIILPATVLCILWLTNRRDVMGEKVNGRWANVALGLILLFALFMCAQGLGGLLGNL